MNAPVHTLPQWQSRGIAGADKIFSIEFLDGELKYQLTLEHGMTVTVDEKIASQGQGVPDRGDYYIRYSNGYESWLPASIFEEGYTMIPGSEPISPELAEALNYDRPVLLTEMEVPATTNGDILRRARELILGSDAMMQGDARHTANELQRLLDTHFCFAKANITEPLFTLRGRDRLASRLVREWAKRAKKHQAKNRKVKLAKAIADDMKTFPGRRYPT